MKIFKSFSNTIFFTPLKAMDYRMFCEKIEEIGAILKELSVSKNIIEFLNLTEGYFKGTMDAYLRNDFSKAHEVWFKNDELVNKQKSY